jgi:hypothetical protein
MAVTAIFWFHPLVWWLGARLMDERERACDEAVVRLGHEPRVYAETILAACRLFLESPLACVSGVTGSDLPKRIERILLSVRSESLTPVKKALVSAVPIAAVIAPFVVGVLNAPPARAQQIAAAPGKSPEFDVASVKPNRFGIAGKVSIQTRAWRPIHRGERHRAAADSLRLPIAGFAAFGRAQVAGRRTVRHRGESSRRHRRTVSCRSRTGR